MRSLENKFMQGNGPLRINNWLRCACVGLYFIACYAKGEELLQEFELSSAKNRTERVLVLTKAAGSGLEAVNLVFLSFPPIGGRTSNYCPIGSSFVGKTEVAVDDFLGTGKKMVWVTIEYGAPEAYLLSYEHGKVRTLYSTLPYSGRVWSKIRRNRTGRCEIDEMWEPKYFPKEEGPGILDTERNLMKRVMMWDGQQFSPKK